MRGAWADPVVLALALSQLVISASLYYLFPALVLFWQDDFGWSLPQIMGAFSTALIMQGLTAKAIGRWLDRGLGPWMMVGGGGLAALGLVALTFVESLAVFYLVWALLGLAMGLTLYDAVFALIIRSRGAQAMAPIAVITLVAGFASSIAFVIAGIVGEALGWRAVVCLMATAIVLVHVPMVLSAALRLEHGVTAAKWRPVASASFRRRPGYWPLTLAITLSALGLGMVISHVMPLLAWTGVDPRLALIAAALIGVAQVAGRLLVTLIGSGWNRPMLVAICLMGLAGALLALVLAPQWPVLILAFAMIQGACYGISSALRPMLIHDLLGQQSFGAAQGAVLAPAFIAFGLAPLLAASVVAWAGYVALIMLCLCVQIISSAVLLDGCRDQDVLMNE